MACSSPAPLTDEESRGLHTMANHYFLSYSTADAADFALRLADELTAGPPSFPAWLDRRELRPGDDWDEQIAEAIRGCKGLLFVMTRDSVTDNCVCKQEWTRALKYKKPVVPLCLHRDAELPFRLEPRQYVDFSGDFKVGLAKLRRHLAWLDSPEGVLHALKDRLADAQRDQRRARDDVERARIADEIAQLAQQIAAQQAVVERPAEVAARVQESIAAGLERERTPERPAGGEARTKFINPPPAPVPGYFQDRYLETKLVADFLRDDGLRLLTVVGRGGIGKTAMVVRLLRALERGQLPDDLGPFPVAGIVYLSQAGSRRVDFPNLFADLCRLLPADAAGRLDALYRDPKVAAGDKLRALLAALPVADPVILLLDNLEDLLDENRALRDRELDQVLRALLGADDHRVKAIITTRVPPGDLLLAHPERQQRLDLDEGLASPYAENILRAMDRDGKVGLRDAPDALLADARERTRGYPRALEALFGILSADRDTTLPEVLAAAGAALPEHVVEVLVGEAYSRLDRPAQLVMEALAVFGRPVRPVAVDFLLQPYQPGADSAAVLKRLVNMHFVRPERGTYYLHQVDRAYALSRIPADGAARGEKAPGRKGRKAPPAYTQPALLRRAADYFSQTRRPREAWRSLDDLAPQLAELDLRCAAGEYDVAADVLREIDFDCLLLWGHYALLVALHERLLDRLDDPWRRGYSLNTLGTRVLEHGHGKARHRVLRAGAGHRPGDRRPPRRGGWSGQPGDRLRRPGGDALQRHRVLRAGAGHRPGDRRPPRRGSRSGQPGERLRRPGEDACRAIEFHEQALAIAREIGDRRGEGSWLGNLGNAYAAWGRRAAPSSATSRRWPSPGRSATAAARGCGWATWGSLRRPGETRRAIEFYEQALAIAREIGDRRGEGVWSGQPGERLRRPGGDAPRHRVLRAGAGHRPGDRRPL